MRKLDVQYRAVETLIPFARNARTHSDAQVAQIAASIREFGWTNPVLVDGENGIIAGHGRVLAARKLGMEQVPCIELGDLSPTQKRAYIIADNKLAENAGWDRDLLKLEIEEFDSEGFNIELLGFEAGELSEILGFDKIVNDKKDIQDSEKFCLMVEYENESQLQNAYQEAIAKGLPCKIIQ